MTVDTTLPYDDRLRFRKNFDDCHYYYKMKPDYERAIRAKEVDYELGRTIARKSAVSHGDLKKFEKLSGKNVLPTGTHEKIGQQIFQYTPLVAKFDEQKKAIEKQGDQMVKAIKGLPDEEDEGDRKKLPALMAGMRGFDQAKGTVDSIYDGLKEDQAKYIFEVNKQTTYGDPTKNIVKQGTVRPSEMIDAMIREPDKSHNIYKKTIRDLQKIYEDNVKGAHRLTKKQKGMFRETNTELTRLYDPFQITNCIGRSGLGKTNALC